MSKELILHISNRDISYPILFQERALDTSILREFCQSLGSKIAVIADSNLARLAGPKILDYFGGCCPAEIFTFPAGETYKTRETKSKLEDLMLEAKLGRDTCLVGLGGGVTTDLAGFLAATYCRGIPFISIPTSLLAMVDSSIGGKTAVNTPKGKNLIGSLYHPKAVLIDSSYLRTLPEDEIKNGLAEVIKYSLVQDRQFFYFLKKNMGKLLECNLEYLEAAIYQSCLIKKRIVEEDPNELGKRRLLNFGHTIGHAIEKIFAYRIPHGRAVAIGCLAESYLSKELGLLDDDDFEEIAELILLSKHDLDIGPLRPEDMLEAMAVDKKAAHGTPRFVTLRGIGEPYIPNEHFCIAVDKESIYKTLDWMNNALRRN